MRKHRVEFTLAQLTSTTDYLSALLGIVTSGVKTEYNQYVDSRRLRNLVTKFQSEWHKAEKREIADA